MISMHFGHNVCSLKLQSKIGSKVVFFKKKKKNKNVNSVDTLREMIGNKRLKQRYQKIKVRVCGLQCKGNWFVILIHHNHRFSWEKSSTHQLHSVLRNSKNFVVVYLCGCISKKKNFWWHVRIYLRYLKHVQHTNFELAKKSGNKNCFLKRKLNSGVIKWRVILEDWERKCRVWKMKMLDSWYFTNKYLLPSEHKKKKKKKKKKKHQIKKKGKINCGWNI